MNEITEVLKSLLYAMSGFTLSIAILGSVWVNGISRNPEAAKTMFVPGIIAMAALELVTMGCLGLFALNISRV